MSSSSSSLVERRKDIHDVGGILSSQETNLVKKTLEEIDDGWDFGLQWHCEMWMGVGAGTGLVRDDDDDDQEIDEDHGMV